MRRIRQPGQPSSAAGRARRPRVRQASATSATLTPEQRARQQAMTEPLRRQQALRAERAARNGRSPAAGGRPGPPAPGRDARLVPGPGAAGRTRPALRRPTGLALAAIGAILWLGVRVHMAYLEIQTAGFILLVLGVVWLWLPVPAKRQLVGRQVGRMIGFVDGRPARQTGDRWALADLLQRRSGPRRDRSPQSEHLAD